MRTGHRLLAPLVLAAVIASSVEACGDELPEAESPAPPPRDGGSADDAADAADGRVPSCPELPFTTVVHRPDLSTPGDEQSVTLSLDELEVFVGTTHVEGIGDYDLYTARRSSTSEPFPALVRADGLSSPREDYAAALTSDGTGIVFASQRNAADAGDGGAQDLFFTFRDGPERSFTNAVVPLGTLNSAASEAAPFFAPGNVLYFSRGTPSMYRVMRATRIDQTTFAAPEEVPELNEGGGESFSVVISNDGTTIYFGTDARPTSQATDIFVAKRPGASGPFGAPVRAPDPGLNTVDDERPGFLSADGCRLYIVSNRPGGKGAKDVWLATRGP